MKLINAMRRQHQRCLNLLLFAFMFNTQITEESSWKVNVCCMLVCCHELVSDMS